ncbi:MAG: DUF4258 domain-containing protein [Chloroflexi bacterium]|nr:DUF4258 domain-containing protein [Chloroflexota bacterium]
MEYVLTEHARDVLEKRQIPLAWIERALSAPEATEADTIDPDLEHRLARIQEKGDRVLRVIVNRSSKPMRVVTAFFDRRRSIP